MLSPLNDGVLTRINLPASINIMLAIFVGYLVGQIFRFSRASDDQIVDKDYIYQPKTVRPIFLSLILAIGLNILFVIGEQDNVFLMIRQVTSTFTVTDNHLFSTFMMGLLNTFSAWIGNSQAFALNSIAEDSFALENLTYAVSHHTTTGLPHLYTLTNLYHSYGLVAGTHPRFPDRTFLRFLIAQRIFKIRRGKIRIINLLLLQIVQAAVAGSRIKVGFDIFYLGSTDT